jgi:hypothetical protein
MRIGELLLERRSVEWGALALALDDHAGTGIRLASFLVARGEVDFEDASRALGEQHRVAAALRRHIERRDPEVAGTLPVALARRHCALPLGRLANGTLIICVRDPSAELQAELARAVGGEVTIAVAPAKYLERLVENAYPPGTSGELEIPVDLDDSDEAEDLSGLAFDLPPDDDSAADAGVDFAIDIDEPSEVAAARASASTSRALPVAFTAPAAGAASQAACKDIDELPWLLDVVMDYVAKRWSGALLVEIRERRGVGVRGHGARLKPAAIKTFVVALDEPSIIQLARDERRIIETLPDPPSEDDASLAAALAGTAVVAAPILNGEAVSYVLAVGDPIDKDPDETPIDLGLLTEAVGDALARL